MVLSILVTAWCHKFWHLLLVQSILLGIGMGTAFGCLFCWSVFFERLPHRFHFLCGPETGGIFSFELISQFLGRWRPIKGRLKDSFPLEELSQLHRHSKNKKIPPARHVLKVYTCSAVKKAWTSTDTAILSRLGSGALVLQSYFDNNVDIAAGFTSAEALLVRDLLFLTFI